MAKKVKAITTIIEDDVTFMTDPDVQFVSLVKHGANRTPFKVLKTEKEDTQMKKVVQSILVRNDISKDQKEKALEGLSKKSATEFKTFTSYPQLSLDRCEDESFSLVKHEDIDGVFVLLADLKEGDNHHGTLEVDAKEAVDYATMDMLYTELYSMADIVSGTMRQENAGLEFRKSTILTAIENFKTFAEVVLSSMDASKADCTVNPDNHPTFAFPLIKTEKADVKDEETEEKKEETPEEKKEETEEKKEETPDTKENEGMIAQALANLSTSIASMTEQLTSSLKSIKEEQVKQSEALKSEVKDLKKVTTTAKSETDEEDVETNKGDIWAGTLFNRQ